ncbi:hypothetical protein FBU30_002936 [Linnemannia zychae]|nr:hypothetical protein FBU30_002936 [Linnemannia zychae]
MFLTKLASVSKRTATPTLGAIRTIVNKATIIGRVGQDAELNNVGNGRSVVHFSVATSENKVDTEGNIIKTTQWHRIVSWDQKRNPLLADHVKKGDMVYVEGPIYYRSYTSKDGIERQMTEINLKSFLPVNPKP